MGPSVNQSAPVEKRSDKTWCHKKSLAGPWESTIRGN